MTKEYASVIRCSLFPRRRAVRLAVLTLLNFLLFVHTPLWAQPASNVRAGSDLPAIAIIIDDLGNTYERDKQAVTLPGQLTYSFLPHTAYSKQLANLAYQLHKDVMLHLPMQSTESLPLGPGGLTLDMGANEFIKSFRSSLSSIPHAIGINNHMGSLLTQHPGYMQWLMQAINETGDLFFIDSLTAPKSVALQIATENWVPSMKRDVFLDSQRESQAIDHQFQRLLEIARKNGIALAIGHPYPETLAVLENLLPTLSQKGVRLIPVSQLLNLHLKRFQTWRAYLSP
jgi:polysaccharide deacetylase 2 family uncharacterized protein YibQ